MYLSHLSLTDFRSYPEAELQPAASGITLVTGANGAGKTNLIEAVAYLATLKSMRGSPTDALVRAGARQAVLRGTVVHPGSGGRRLDIAAEISGPGAGRDRVQVNGQPLRRSRDLLGSLQVTVFSPDDLALVKGGPALRRDYLDDLLVALSPKQDLLLSEVERVLKQRNALLKSAFSPGGGGGGWRPGRPLPEDVRTTLEVWDAKLAAAGTQLADARQALVGSLLGPVEQAYRELAAGSAPPGRQLVAMSYQRCWAGELGEALAASRRDDLRRGVTTVGPHRDELHLEIGALAARTHASQGEQRTLALALRLAGHHLVTATVGEAPVLLLDDVFSELDPARAESLMRNLAVGPPSAGDRAAPGSAISGQGWPASGAGSPGSGAGSPGQAILTSAGDLPAAAVASLAARLRVEDGKVLG